MLITPQQLTNHPLKTSPINLLQTNQIKNDKSQNQQIRKSIKDGNKRIREDFTYFNFRKTKDMSKTKQAKPNKHQQSFQKISKIQPINTKIETINTLIQTIKTTRIDYITDQQYSKMGSEYGDNDYDKELRVLIKKSPAKRKEPSKKSINQKIKLKLQQKRTQAIKSSAQASSLEPEKKAPSIPYLNNSLSPIQSLQKIFQYQNLKLQSQSNQFLSTRKLSKYNQIKEQKTQLNDLVLIRSKTQVQVKAKVRVQQQTSRIFQKFSHIKANKTSRFRNRKLFSLNQLQVTQRQHKQSKQPLIYISAPKLRAAPEFNDKMIKSKSRGCITPSIKQSNKQSIDKEIRVKTQGLIFDSHVISKLPKWRQPGLMLSPSKPQTILSQLKCLITHQKSIPSHEGYFQPLSRQSTNLLYNNQKYKQGCSTQRFSVNTLKKKDFQMGNDFQMGRHKVSGIKFKAKLVKKSIDMIYSNYLKKHQKFTKKPQPNVMPIYS